MANASIRKCTCTHAQQDALYGAGMRAHNPKKKGKLGEQEYSCTACGKGLSDEHRKKRGMK